MANAPAWSVVSPCPRGIFPSARTGPHPSTGARPLVEVRVVLSKWGEERVRSRVGRGLAPCRGLGTLRPTSSSVKGEDGEEVGGRKNRRLRRSTPLDPALGRGWAGEAGAAGRERAPGEARERGDWEGPPERDEALGE